MNLNSKKYTKYYILALISIIGLALYSNTNTVIEGADSDEERKKKLKKNKEKFQRAPPILRALLYILMLLPMIARENGPHLAILFIYYIMIKDKEIEKLIGGDGKGNIKELSREEVEKTYMKLYELLAKRIGFTDDRVSIEVLF